MCVFGQLETVDELYNKGMNLYNAEKYEEAIPYFEKCEKLEENYSEIKISSILLLSTCYSTIENYTEAIKYEYQLSEIFKQLFGEDDSNYASALVNMALHNYYLGNVQEAITLGTQGVEIQKKILGEEHPDYVSTLIMLATYYVDANNYQEAIKIDTEIVTIQKKTLGEEDPDYATSLHILAANYRKLGNYREAIRFCTQAMEIRKKVLGENHPDYAETLHYLAMDYYEIGNYQEALRLCSEATEIRKKVLGENHIDYVASLGNLASYHSELGNYQEAINLNTQLVEISKKMFGKEHPDYAMALDNLASSYYFVGNYQEAIKLGTQAMEIRKKTLGGENSEYAASLNNLAIYYSALGNYQEATKLNTLAVEIQKKTLGEEDPLYATSLNNLAADYSKMGNYQEAIRYTTLAMEIKKKVLGEEHPDYAASLQNLASYNSQLGNYQEAIRFDSEAMEIKKKVLGEEHPDYAKSLLNMASRYFQLGNYQEAIRLNSQAIEIFKKVLGEEHPDYAKSLSNMTEYYFQASQYEEATMYIKQTYNRYETLVLKTFAYLTNKERSGFWNMYSYFFNDRLPYYATVQPNNTLKIFALNGQLLSKGLLLNAELEMQNLIEQQDNEQVKELYYKLKQDRKILDELYQLSPNKRTMDADSLSKVVDNEERRLVESCQEIGDYTKNLSIKWTDVQQHLKDNDIAIEFTNFTDISKQNIYIALILKKGMTSPELVKLDYSESDTVDYTTHLLYNKIWKPLDNYLQDVQNVYFSPTGKFHNIGIEYLPDENGEIFAKKYSAYRLSSTRELAITKTTNPNKKASVYGGIVYDFDEADWQNVAEEEAERAGMTFLKGAKKESEEITLILSDGSFDVEFGTDKAATEESFKKLSGSGIKILHIATHGFYEPETKENSFADMLSSGEEHSKEDRSLSRSGLFFAGANTALNPEQRQFIPEGVDDGILTAKEISRLDFKGLDLVVLSACQTGLGEVTGEGVFGLQRGFKKAGAQTIIMSLWNVSDKPTKELMTDFYRNLMAGKSKREAFISAQDKIRQKYINPKMWAGFIMVDGEE